MQQESETANSIPKINNLESKDAIVGISDSTSETVVGSDIAPASVGIDINTDLKKHDSTVITEDDSSLQYDDMRIRNGDPNEDKSQEDEVIVPDGGRGWLVVLSSFVICTIISGVHSVDLLSYVSLSDFKSSDLIVTVYSVVPLLCGPIASALVNKYGCQYMTIFGGIVPTLGYIFASISIKSEITSLAFVFIAGFGLSFVNVTSVVPIVFWFKKKRNLAVGLAASGTAVGAFIYLPLAHYVLGKYGHVVFMIFLSASLLILCIFGCFMRYPEWWTSEQKRQRNKHVENSNREVYELMGKEEQNENHISPNNNEESSNFDRKEVWFKAWARRFAALFYVFKNRNFVILLLSTIISFFWLIVPSVIFQKHMLLLGNEDCIGTFIIGMICTGISYTIGVVIFGWIVDKCKFSIITIYGTCLIMCGGLLAAVPMVFYCGSLVFIFVASNFLFAATFILLPSLLVELVTLDNFTSAYGWVLFGQGIGQLFGPPSIGQIFELTDYTPEPIFYLAGGFIAVAGLLIYLIRIIEGCKKYRRAIVMNSRRDSLESVNITINNSF